jgi:hypothetical protein
LFSSNIYFVQDKAKENTIDIDIDSTFDYIDFNVDFDSLINEHIYKLSSGKNSVVISKKIIFRYDDDGINTKSNLIQIHSIYGFDNVFEISDIKVKDITNKKNFNIYRLDSISKKYLKCGSIRFSKKQSYIKLFNIVFSKYNLPYSDKKIFFSDFSELSDILYFDEESSKYILDNSNLI